MTFIEKTVYYDVPHRKGRDGKSSIVDVVMNFTSGFGTARFWEVRVSQIPFSQRAPAGCLQYFSGHEGTIQVLLKYPKISYHKRMTYIIFSVFFEDLQFC